MALVALPCASLASVAAVVLAGLAFDLCSAGQIVAALVAAETIRESNGVMSSIFPDMTQDVVLCLQQC